MCSTVSTGFEVSRSYSPVIARRSKKSTTGCCLPRTSAYEMLTKFFRVSNTIGYGLFTPDCANARWMSFATCMAANGGMDVMVTRRKFENFDIILKMPCSWIGIWVYASTSYRDGSAKYVSCPLT